jgi:serine/threonine protein kinase
MSEGQLTQLEKKLRLDLQILHDKAGICHGDIKEDNIMVTVTSHPNDGDTQIPIFIDFSHAMGMNEYDTERDWERWCDGDHDSLSFVFAMEKDYRASWRVMQSMSGTTLTCYYLTRDGPNKVVGIRVGRGYR